MHLVERFWTALACITDWLVLLPADRHGLPQQPMLSGLDVKTSEDHPHFPIFKPPGGHPGSDFTCDYRNMPGWLSCSTTENRGCWLRHPNGRKYDILTDYENDAPIGIKRNYTLIVNDGSINADGMEFRDAKLFNDMYPGPWIQACWGDIVSVTVINNLTHNGTSIHWHGIRQNQTMHMDGVNGITQCPIAPLDSFTYTRNVTQYGSSWYHSHYSVQYADGMQGPITLHGPSSASYDAPIDPILMTDWGHNSAFEALYTPPGLLYQSILLNGIGSITRFSNISSDTVPPPYELHFEATSPVSPNRPKRYLLRLINTSFGSTFIFSIDNHRLQVIRRYHVVVEASPVGSSPPDGNFWIRTEVPEGGCGSSGISGYEETGILRYNSASETIPTSQKWAYEKKCSDEPYGSLEPKLPWFVGQHPANGKQGERFGVVSSHGKDTKPFPVARFSMDRVVEPTVVDIWNTLQVDYDDPIFLHLDKDASTFPKKWVVIPENYSSTDWVYLVITGDKKVGDQTTAHPIHLHGHDFAILQQAEGTRYSPENLHLKLDNPPRRDVVLLPRNGFVVIAFKADNPGNWLMHCHIATHASQGLGLQILERQADADKIWPHGNSHALDEANRVCKNWKAWHSDCHNWWPGFNDTSNPYPACKDAKAWVFQDDSGV